MFFSDFLGWAPQVICNEGIDEPDGETGVNNEYIIVRLFRDVTEVTRESICGISRDLRAAVHQESSSPASERHEKKTTVYGWYFPLTLYVPPAMQKNKLPVSYFDHPVILWTIRKTRLLLFPPTTGSAFIDRQSLSLSQRHSPVNV
jgi:hypothetical protein